VLDISSRRWRVSLGVSVILPLSLRISREVRMVSRRVLQLLMASFAKARKSWGLCRFGSEKRPGRDVDVDVDVDSIE